MNKKRRRAEKPLLPAVYRKCVVGYVLTIGVADDIKLTVCVHPVLAGVVRAFAKVYAVGVAPCA